MFLCTDDDTYCVASCEPNTAGTSDNVKHLSVKGKVTNVVDDHGLIDDYIYFHFKSKLFFEFIEQ